MRSERSFRLLYVLPATVLLASLVLPLMTGGSTLYFRDLFNAHLEMKWFQTEAMRDGVLPLVDPLRGGGQPHLGNLNTVALYPDNLLYLVTPFFWAFNAHLWLHLLLAPFAFFAFARAWGLGREAAWAAAVCYGASGYVLSHLNFYNLMAGVALAPALGAACLRLAARASGRGFAAVGGLWTLMLLAGDPTIAALAGLLAASAVLARHGARPAALGRLAGAVAAGTLMAAPQLVEFLRVLPESFRGHWGFSAAAATVASWNPATAIEWLVPFAFGPPDFTFWGHALHQGHQPFYLSLYPGALALAMVAASGVPRSRAARWAWGVAAAGLFLAAGAFNPAARWLLAGAGQSLLRLPVKLWLAVALGAALLCGLGFERLRAAAPRARRAAWLLAAAYLALAVALVAAAAPARGLLRRAIPARFDDAFVDAERLRWALLCAAGAAVVALAAWLFSSRRVGPRLAGAAVVALHVASQVLLLGPLAATDRVEPYREPSPLATHLQPGERLVHGSFDELFGPVRLPVGRYPDTDLRWRQRQIFYELYPPAGMLAGHPYEFNPSPEGLDAFLSRVTGQAIKRAGDADRLRILAASGVDGLILERRLAPDAEALAEHVAEVPSLGGALHLYRPLRRAAPVQWAGRLQGSAHLNEALAAITAPEFDPTADAVLAGPVAPRPAAAGEVRVVAESREAVEIAVRAEGSGAVLVQRAFPSLYRATLDGEPAAIRVANLHRMAVEVPAGEHRVSIRVDRAPLRRGLALAAAGLTLLLAGAVWTGGARRAPRLG